MPSLITAISFLTLVVSAAAQTACAKVASTAIPECAHDCFNSLAPKVGCKGFDDVACECAPKASASLLELMPACLETACPRRAVRSVIAGASSGTGNRTSSREKSRISEANCTLQHVPVQLPPQQLPHHARLSLVLLFRLALTHASHLLRQKSVVKGLTMLPASAKPKPAPASWSLFQDALRPLAHANPFVR
jgi:hypothetical protein